MQISNLLEEAVQEFDEVYNFVASKFTLERKQDDALDVEKLRKQLDGEREELASCVEEIENLKKEIAVFEEQNRHISSDAAQLTALIEQRGQVCESLTEEKRSNESNCAKLKKKHNLYMLITKIHWSKCCDLSEVQGFVNRDKLKPFRLSRNENSVAFISHYLWNLVSDC